MIAVMLSLLINPHGVKDLKPVIIGRTGLGVWRCCMDGRELSYFDRIKLSRIISDVKRPEWFYEPDRKEDADRWAEAMFLKCRAFCHTGFWWDDYTYFHNHRDKLKQAAIPAGFGLIFAEEN